MPFFRRAAILFILFILLVIVAADLGWIGAVFGWLYNFPNGDKAGHFILMGILSLLASLGFSTTRVRIFSLSPLKTSLLIAALVALEEFSQLLFPGRSASILDLAASLAGIFLFGELGAWFRRRSIHPAQQNG